MARPLRIEYPGALYHVTARGNARQPIFQSKADAMRFLEVLGDTALRMGWRLHAYCLMTNHYHLLVETGQANLSRGMRQLNGVYTQDFNRAHRRVGHLFQGRYKAILIEVESYFLELARYVVLNPVRAKLVETPAGWLWSSYRATLGQSDAPEWLEAASLLGRFADDEGRARAAYAAFVSEGIAQPSPWEAVRHQLILGSESFAEKFLAQDGGLKPVSSEVPKRQKRALARSLAEIAAASPTRDVAISAAWATGAFTQRDIGNFFALGYSQVSKIIKRQGK
ncbi:MAG: transposase [Alphaproteobacteria bacterium]|nr:transposase [Alphaproteobacteria bacterium]